MKRNSIDSLCQVFSRVICKSIYLIDFYKHHFSVRVRQSVVFMQSCASIDENIWDTILLRYISKNKQMLE